MVSVTIKVDGQEISERHQLLSVDVTTEYNKIASAELKFIDGDMTNQEFEILDSPLFLPGKQVEIKLKYEGNSADEKTVFKGVIIKQGLQIDALSSVLVIELSDPAIKMTTVRKSAVFKDQKDSAVFSSIIGTHGLKSKVDATDTQYDSLVQYYASDWDYVLTRAEANGLVIITKGGMVLIEKPSLSGPTAASFELGRGEIFELDFEADARGQVNEVEYSLWNAKDQKVDRQTSQKTTLEQGNYNAATFAEVVDGNNDKRMSAIGLEVEEARTAANGIEMKHRLSMLKGRLKVVGTAQVEVGDLIELKGVSARFSGKTLVTGIRHQLAGGDWFTNIQFGLSAEPFAATANIIDAKAAGLLPAVNGLQIGKVIKVDNDPLKEHRVEVMLPAITNSEESLWARISSMYAGNQTGAFFLPEIDDEVIVGFLNDDPRHPVILGSVHSSAKPAPFEANDKNNLKGIVTAAGLTISFDEEKKLITIQTSENNRITINEEDKQIEIADVNKNFIRLNKDGITIESGKDFIVKAQGEIKMEANKNVGLKGMKVDIT